MCAPLQHMVAPSYVRFTRPVQGASDLSTCTFSGLANKWSKGTYVMVGSHVLGFGPGVGLFSGHVQVGGAVQGTGGRG
jgi:hypothetical protein